MFMRQSPCRSVPELESTIDKIHTQAECITSLFPWLNNRR